MRQRNVIELNIRPRADTVDVCCAVAGGHCDAHGGHLAFAAFGLVAESEADTDYDEHE